MPCSCDAADSVSGGGAAAATDSASGGAATDAAIGAATGAGTPAGAGTTGAADCTESSLSRDIKIALVTAMAVDADDT